MEPNNIKEMLLFRNNNYDFIGFCKLNQPTYNSRSMHRSYHYITSRLWNNLPDDDRRAPSLNSFKLMLDEVNLTTRVECNCNFWNFLVGFHIARFPLCYWSSYIFIFISSYIFYFIFFFRLNMFWIYSNLARSRLKESGTVIRVMWINKIPTYPTWL